MTIDAARSLLFGLVLGSLAACAGEPDGGSADGGGMGGSSATGGSGGGVAISGASGAASGAANSGTGGGGSGSGGSGGATAGSGGSSAGSGGVAGGGGESGEGSGGAAGGGGSAAGAGGAAGGGAAGGGAAGSGGGGATSCVAGSRRQVQLATSIPQQFKQRIANAGAVVKRSYPCHYYTDLTAGQSGDPSRFVLERRNQPITKQANVYLPYNYDSSVGYPTIYVLHGITDNEETWFERGDPHPAVLLDNLIASGEIRPIVAVFPNGNSSSTFLDRSFGNQAGYYFFANELIGDLIPFVEAEYSVASERNCRAISGFSMGGMQTINTGLCQSLEHLAWFGALAAAPTTYGSTQIAEYVGRENASGSYPVGFFYNVVGASDGTARSSHEAAVQDLTNKSEHLTEENFAYHTVPGGHDYSVASIGLYNFLRISFAP